MLQGNTPPQTMNMQAQDLNVLKVCHSFGYLVTPDPSGCFPSHSGQLLHVAVLSRMVIGVPLVNKKGVLLHG